MESNKKQKTTFENFITEDNSNVLGKYVKVQGLLCLNDVKEDDGGFFTGKINKKLN